jgi:UDP-N-acetylmuramoyl-tripeptide--D-alanyl-D-alanine ligase
LLRIQKDAQFAVIEMGANHQQEIAGYCAYVQPTHGIITNAGKAHLEGFGGEEGVRKGKGELFEYLRANNGSIFAFDDYDYLHEMTANIPKVSWYGTQKGAVRGHVLQSEPFLQIEMTFGVEFTTLQTQLVGSYNLPNVLCAIAVGKYFDVPEFKITAALSHYIPSNSRSQLMTAGSNKIILDAYNANPSSMKAAIENFAKIDAPAKVLLLGAMMELGAESVAEHQHLVSLIGQHPWQQVVLVGGDFANVQHPYQYFASSTEAGEWVKARQFTNTYFLIKGSRSMQMEKITPSLM